MKSYGISFLIVGIHALAFNILMSHFEIVDPLGIQKIDGVMIALVGVIMMLVAHRKQNADEALRKERALNPNYSFFT